MRKGRRDSSSEERREEESPSPSPSPSPSKRPLPGMAIPVRKEKGTEREREDVFGALLAGAKSLGKDRGREKMMREMNGPVGRSEFVMNEAEEEDDDEMLGWGGTLKRKVGGAGGDEDDEGEDDGRDLVGLLDERVIGEDEIARERVVEKAREHEEQDDAKIAKVVHDVVQGRMRTKRRNRGLGMEDSDSEEEDEEARMLRRKSMNKKRRIEGDKLEDLAKNPETRAFYDAYRSHLDEDDAFAKIVADEDEEMNVDGGPVEGHDKNNENEEGPREEITAEEVRRAIRAGQFKSEPTLDIHNVAWVDEDENDDDEEENENGRRFNVREVSFAGPATSTTGARSKVMPPPMFGGPRAERDVVDYDHPVKRPTRAESNEDTKRLTLWAKEESMTRGMSSGSGMGSASGAAVTGHGKKKVAPNGKSGGGGGANGSGRSGSAGAGAASAKSKGKRALEKQPSVLARLGDRKDRFTS